jgi:hypothetical protein
MSMFHHTEMAVHRSDMEQTPAFMALMAWSERGARIAILNLPGGNEKFQLRLETALHDMKVHLLRLVAQALKVFHGMMRVCALCAAWSWRVVVNIHCQATMPFKALFEPMVAERRALAQHRQERIREALVDWYVASLHLYHSWQRQA